MPSLRHLRTLGLASALVLGGTLAAQAADMTTMPTTIDPVPGDASALEMKTTLQKLGFTQIGTVAHSGDVYTTKAKWQGEWVDLRIDARTGGIENRADDPKVIAVTTGMTAQAVRDELQRVGFTSVDNVEFTGNVITATALHYGQQTAVRIDAETGVVAFEAMRDRRASNAIALPRENLTAADLRDRLAPLGYADVRNVTEQGDVYTLDAYRDGRWVALRIDAENGGVTVVK